MAEIQVSIGQKPESQSCYIKEDRLRTFFLLPGGTYVCDVGLLQVLQGLEQSGPAGVESMIIRQRDNVKSTQHQNLHCFRVSAEYQVLTRGMRAHCGKRTFQITEGDICLFQFGGNLFNDIGAALAVYLLAHGAIQHNVAHRRQCQLARGRGRNTSVGGHPTSRRWLATAHREDE